jgi:hypothetical protein
MIEVEVEYGTTPELTAEAIRAQLQKRQPDNGQSFQQLGPSAQIYFSWRKGSCPALFAYSTQNADSGFQLRLGTLPNAGHKSLVDTRAQR